MKTVVFFLLLPCLQCCFGQTDTNLLAVGDWSEPVHDGHYGLRGRLLVYDDTGANHARVYLELQHLWEGGWEYQLEVYVNVSDYDGDIRFELRDGLGKPIPQELPPLAIVGPPPYPSWVTLPCDSTVRLRADIWSLGGRQNPGGLEVFVNGGDWVIRPNATNDVFLSATFTPPSGQPSSPNYHVWSGTLTLPKVRLPVKKP